MKRCNCSFANEKNQKDLKQPSKKTPLCIASEFSFCYHLERQFINQPGGYMQSTDQTIARIIKLVKDTVPPVRMEGQVWYDVTNQGLEAEVKLLRLKGELAEHPLISTLVRFN